MVSERRFQHVQRLFYFNENVAVRVMSRIYPVPTNNWNVETLVPLPSFRVGRLGSDLGPGTEKGRIRLSLIFGAFFFSSYREYRILKNQSPAPHRGTLGSAFVLSKLQGITSNNKMALKRLLVLLLASNTSGFIKHRAFVTSTRQTSLQATPPTMVVY
jgi:hypothetical protein